jgi:exodeoxyribonuclease X
MSIVLFTVIDLETTGLAPPASVVEIGVTRLYYDTETKAVEIKPPEARLFKPAEPMAPEVIAVHHLTDAMLAQYEPCTEETLHDIVTQERPQFLVAANAAFEQQWITNNVAGMRRTRAHLGRLRRTWRSCGGARARCQPADP